MNISNLDTETIERILKWHGRYYTPFEVVAHTFELLEKQVIALMQQETKGSSYLMWRERVTGLITKYMK